MFKTCIFEQIVNSINGKLKTLKSLSTPRWAYRSEAISAVKINYSLLLVAIKQIIDSTKQSDIRAKGLGIIFQLKAFELFHPILNTVIKMSTFLQISNIILLTAMEVVDSLKESLK